MSVSQSGAIPAEELAVMRDVLVAQEVRSMAALGAFPKEIIVYGLVYYREQQRYYMISSDSGKLISFLNDVANRKWFPTPIETYSERLIIPEGYETDIINRMKLKLAKKLQQIYPISVFRRLEQLQQKMPNNSMAEALLQHRKKLEDVFSADKIQAFQDVCINAYLRRTISEVVYQELNQWCEKRLIQLENYVAPVSCKDKIFYGIAVFKHHTICKCVINANLNYIYREKCRMEEQGLRTTSWHKKMIPVKTQVNLQEINQLMTQFLHDIYTEQILLLIEQMEQLPGAIELNEMNDVIKELAVYGEKAEALGRLYGQLWGVIARKGES